MKLQKLAVLLLITFFTVLLFLACHKFQQDDAYIFYKYARNIAEGNGFVFNIGERINAVTSPLYTLLLAFVYYILMSFNTGIDVPIIGEIIGAVSIWVSAYMLFNIFMYLRKERLAVLAPLFFLVNPLFRNGSGMESFLVMALILSALYSYIKGKEEITALLSALAFLARFDAALFIIALLGWHIYKYKKLPSTASIFIFIAILLSWFVFSKVYFGSFLPTTIAIKLQQEKLQFYGTGLIFLKGFIKIFPGGIVTAVSLSLLFVISSGYLYFKNRKAIAEPPVSILLLWQILYFITYSFILNPPPYMWYYTPFIILFTVIFMTAFNELFSSISNKKLSIGILLIIIIGGTILPVKLMRGQFTPKYQAYTKAAEYLNANAIPGSSVLIDEVGILGYFYNNGKVIDALGLINPESAQKLYDKKYDWTIKHYKPDYIIADYPNTPQYINIKNMPSVKDNYKTIVILSQGNRLIIQQKVKEF